MEKNVAQNKKELTRRIKTYMMEKGLDKKNTFSIKELEEIAINCSCCGFDVMMVCRFGRII